MAELTYQKRSKQLRGENLRNNSTMVSQQRANSRVLQDNRSEGRQVEPGKAKLVQGSG